MHHGFGYFEEDRLKKSGDLTLWRRILTYIGPHWREVAGAIIFSLIITGCSLALPHLVRLAVDDFIINPELTKPVRLAGVSHLAIIFLILVAGGFLANFCQVVILEWTGQRVMHRMRQDLFRHMLSLDSRFFNTNPVGKLVTRLTNDIQNMHEMFTSIIVTLCNDLVRVVVILIVLALMNWRLALLMLLLVPVIVLNTLLFSRLARLAFREIRTQLARLNSFLQEALSGLSVIQTCNREADTRQRFADLNQAYTERTLYQIKIFGIFMPMLELLSATAIALIIWYGGGQIIQGQMTLGVLIAFLSYMRLFFQPLRELSQKYSIVQSSLASAERIFQLIDTQNSLPRSPAPISAARLAGRIEFRNVTFGYQPDHPVIKDLDFQVAPGETVAIVGATGAGKSTIINLLERFYDPDQGMVLVDGVDLRRYRLKTIRDQMGLVMQDVMILPDTLRKNICLDRDLSEVTLREIIKAAQLERFVNSLEAGVHTRLGDGGNELSAGQRQLLSLARVLARNPRILILDEATSNIDTETEMLIEKAMAATLANRTSVVIAHRLSTIRRADRILVMDQGRIVEVGDHQSLLAGNGIYHHLQMLNHEIHLTGLGEHNTNEET
ncbi:MAG: ABC transporter ATP-binding protein/permease [Proteobacteria bacterium]|nr:ABC transporter ATP-binding protein/permease [Pseudomonadota bacterium]MBU1688120.1 ABC transporter ATP-binding protein/permease [Pseudomonadota bacterium]